MAGLCEQCGLYDMQDDAPYCFFCKEPLSAPDRETCANFIKVQYDGGVRHTPEEHAFFLQNQLESKKMKKIEGLHFRN